MKQRPVLRSYAGPHDLRSMQTLAQSIWSKRSRFHIGDLAWNLKSASASDLEWPIALWESNGSVVAFGWMQSRGDLDLMVHPEHAYLAEEVLDWFERVASSSELSVTILDAETHLADALTARGYQSSDGPFFLYACSSLHELPQSWLPNGFKARTSYGKSELAARAEVHRAAWSAMLVPNPPVSKMNAAIYARLMASWPYDPELDWVIEAPDGRLASCCNAWLDEKNRVGELEPVGTHPDFRRLGLAHAVCTSALSALRRKGAEIAVVYPRGDVDYPVPGKIYADLGFEPYGRTRTYIREHHE